MTKGHCLVLLLVVSLNLGKERLPRDAYLDKSAISSTEQ
jgi:hypothetical protein